MPKLPTDVMPAAHFIMRHLYRPVDLGLDRGYFAVTETEIPLGGDDWLWADDNAKVLEFVSHPDIWRQYPREPTEMLRFCQAMCRGPFIFRRISAPRLDLIEGGGTAAKYEHSLLHTHFDLPKGLVTAGVRFHDNRTAYNVLLDGNRLEFTYKGKRFRLHTKPAISDVSAEPRNGRLEMRMSGDLHFTRLWRRQRLGRIIYVYTIDARSMLIGCEATLDLEPGMTVSDVEMSFAQDWLSHGLNGVRYNAFAAKSPDGVQRYAAPDQRERKIIRGRGVRYYEIAQSEIAGFALAIHSAPREGSPLSEFDIDVKDPGQLHLVRARYRFDGPCRGTLKIAEDKLLTSGGFYDRVDDYAELMEHVLASPGSRSAVIDYSASYDYGAEINAFAKCFAVAANEDLGAEAKACAEPARAMFDRYLQVYDECFVAGHHQKKNTIMSRQLAFVMLGVATMYRVTEAPAYLQKLRELADVLLDFEYRFDDFDGTPASAFPYGMYSERSPFVDGHSSSLLALTQARRFIDDPRYVEAIRRGMPAYCIETTGVGDPPRKVDVVATGAMYEGRRITENSYWNFNVGIALRFFNALRGSPVPELRAIADAYRDRMGLFELVMHKQIERSILERGDAIEIRTSVGSAETNSETQPWVMLGLFGHPYD